MQHILEHVKPALMPLAFHIESQPLLPMVWSDNIVCFARSQEAALQMIVQWKKALWNIARCSVKQGSCVVVPSSVRKIQARQVVMADLVVDIKPEAQILGAFISCNGSDTAHRRLLVGRLQAAFARNQKVLCRDWCDEEARLRFWATLMRGAFYGAATLRPLLETFTRLSIANNGAIRRIQNVLRQPWQNITIHRKHVNAELSLACEQLGLDAEFEFCKQLVRWVVHIWRHPESNIYNLLLHQNDMWLQNKRDQHSSNRPATRSESGCVFRWADGWLSLIGTSFLSHDPTSGWCFDKGNKIAVRARASFLKDWVRPPRTDARPLEDLPQAIVPV